MSEPTAQQVPMLRWWLGAENIAMHIKRWHAEALGEFVAPAAPGSKYYVLTQAGREALASLPPQIGGVPIG